MDKEPGAFLTIGELSLDGFEPENIDPVALFFQTGYLTIQEAQLSMETLPEFKGNVKAVRTDVLVDKAAEAHRAIEAGEVRGKIVLSAGN